MTKQTTTTERLDPRDLAAARTFLAQGMQAIDLLMDGDAQKARLREETERAHADHDLAVQRTQAAQAAQERAEATLAEVLEHVRMATAELADATTRTAATVARAEDAERRIAAVREKLEAVA